MAECADIGPGSLRESRPVGTKRYNKGMHLIAPLRVAQVMPEWLVSGTCHPRAMRHRLTSDSLPFWVDVDLRCYNGRWLAVAELVGERDIGLGVSAASALTAALRVFEEKIRHELVSSADGGVPGWSRPL